MQPLYARFSQKPQLTSLFSSIADWILTLLRLVWDGTTCFFAFHSGADDRACLEFVVQLAAHNRGITATVVRLIPAEQLTADDFATLQTTRDTSGPSEPDVPFAAQLSLSGGMTDTLYPTQNRVASETADNLAIAHWFEQSDGSRTQAEQDGLSRITFASVGTAQPLHMSVARAEEAARKASGPMVVIVGRGRRDAASHTAELSTFLKRNSGAVQSSIANSSEVRKSLGDLAVAYLAAGVGNSLLVLQSVLGNRNVKSKSV